MKKVLRFAVLGLAFVGASSVAADELGQQEFVTYCAGCHGTEGKGDGPLAGMFAIETPDLTLITERAGGAEFPFSTVLSLIDGRDVRAHGGEMPIWGERFQYRAPSQRGETADMVARGRILSLVSYLESIQQ